MPSPWEETLLEQSLYPGTPWVCIRPDYTFIYPIPPSLEKRMRMAAEISELTDLQYIAELLRDKPYRYNVIIPKKEMPSLPKEFEVSLWGDPVDAMEQYRYGKYHAREYDKRWLIHWDQFDPETNPVEFLMNDAPEMLAALAVGAGSGLVAGKLIYQVKEGAGEDKDRAKIESALAGLAVGLITGAGAFYLGREVRKGSK